MTPTIALQPDKLASLVLFQMESAEEDEDALAVVVEGAAKLMLSGALTDETVSVGRRRASRSSLVFKEPHNSSLSPGPQPICQTLPPARDGRQPAAAPVSELLPAGLLLLVVGQPATYAESPLCRSICLT